MRKVAGPIWDFLTKQCNQPDHAADLLNLNGSKTLMMLQFTGRRSGGVYSFPVGYMQSGQTLFATHPSRGGATYGVVLL